jgi:lysyl-tRNA synthetase class II
MHEFSNLEQQRLAKLEWLREQGVDPYPRRVERTHTIAEAIATYQSAEEDQEVQVAVAGRLVSIRVMGKSSFAHIEDGSGRIQLFIRVNEVGEQSYELLKRGYDLGDFVSAKGTMMRTRTGEISVRVRELRLLAKAISPLPVVKEQEVDGQVVRYSAFSDPEGRYRQRYADLAANPEVRQVFLTRARILAAFRRFFDDHDFIEVETPILQPIYGGAAARPFVTHHNQLHQDLYLRISFELYLKRLLVGMYIDYAEHPTAESLTEAMQSIGHQPSPKSSWGKLVDSLLSTHVEPNLIQPTFVLDYPRDISPLAKTKPDDPTHVERFEFFIAGLEMGNAFTELNDPLDQEQRFLEMGLLYDAEDEDAHPLDADYLRAMRYGMPPNGGFGTGVDRLVMLLTDKATIREVLLYPHLRDPGR